MRRVAGLLLVVAAACAVAQPARRDSLGRDRDTIRMDSGHDTKSAADSGHVPSSSTYRPARSPGTAVLLSLLLPGGGQVYTSNWWKAAVIAPAEVTLGYFTYKAHMDASAALGRGDSAAYVGLRDRRTALLWWTGAVIVLSMTDAYVSAEMFGFDREMSLALGPGRVGIRMGL
jgi:hypothetical protein